MLLIEESFLQQNQSIKKKKAIFVLAFIFPPPSFLCSLLISYIPSPFLVVEKKLKPVYCYPPLPAEMKRKDAFCFCLCPHISMQRVIFRYFL